MPSLKEIGQQVGRTINPPSALGKRRFFEQMAITAAGTGVLELDRRLGGERQKVLIRNSVCLFGGYHITCRGDTVYQIALNYYNNPSMVGIIEQDNGIADARRLHIGQVLHLPTAYGRTPTQFEVPGSWRSQLQRRDLLANNQWQPEAPGVGWPFWHLPYPRMIFIHRSDLELCGLPRVGQAAQVFEGWGSSIPVIQGTFVDNGKVVDRTAVDMYSTIWSRVAYDPAQMVLVTCHPSDDQSENPPQRLVFRIQLIP